MPMQNYTAGLADNECACTFRLIACITWAKRRSTVNYVCNSTLQADTVTYVDEVTKCEFVVTVQSPRLW